MYGKWPGSFVLDETSAQRGASKSSSGETSYSAVGITQLVQWPISSAHLVASSCKITCSTSNSNVLR